MRVFHLATSVEPLAIAAVRSGSIGLADADSHPPLALVTLWIRADLGSATPRGVVGESQTGPPTVLVRSVAFAEAGEASEATASPPPKPGPNSWWPYGKLMHGNLRA